MTQKLAWGHININVRDLEASIGFYRKLGFAPFIQGVPYLNLKADTPQQIPDAAAGALELPAGATARACIMQLDDGFPKIDLTELPKDGQHDPLANSDLGLVRLCLVSDDLSATYEELKAQGVEFLSPPAMCHDRLAEVAVCRDPDGTLIELLQVYLDRWGPYLG